MLFLPLQPPSPAKRPAVAADLTSPTQGGSRKSPCLEAVAGASKRLTRAQDGASKRTNPTPPDSPPAKQQRRKPAAKPDGGGRGGGGGEASTSGEVQVSKQEYDRKREAGTRARWTAEGEAEGRKQIASGLTVANFEASFPQPLPTTKDRQKFERAKGRMRVWAGAVQWVYEKGEKFPDTYKVVLGELAKPPSEWGKVQKPKKRPGKRAQQGAQGGSETETDE